MTIAKSFEKSVVPLPEPHPVTTADAVNDVERR
jgi:hypothetical protein